MKQLFINKGKASIHNIPQPTVKKGFVKIKVVYSAISAGTEITSVKGSDKNIIQRAIEDPSKVLRVLDIVKSQGLKNATSKVSSATEKLNNSGYSVSGEVIDVGEGVDDFKVGDLVSAGGSGFAVHAAIVVVPKNLVVKVPFGLDLKLASSGTIGSIALHGVRRADLRIGEYAVVFGVGLIGLLALQMLKVSGVKTACVDINAKRLDLAKELGADLIINPLEEDPVLAIKSWTSDYGADAVLFTAATNSDNPLSQSFKMCRRKGRVVLVGVSGMNINRGDIYKDEIDLMISSSYGPGRYDNSYELDGNDYPYAYVRWTENRNIAEYLNLVKGGKINLDKLNPIKYFIDDASKAYHNIENYPENHILTFLEYGESAISPDEKPIIINSAVKHKRDKVIIGLIGAGNFASSTLLPIIFENSDKFYLKTVVNSTGDKAVNVSKQFKAEIASSNPDDIFNDPDIDLVMICTRHNNHTGLVLKSLQSNKHVYVEKPLAITMDEIQNIENYYKLSEYKETPILMVGFNRRFSLYAEEIKNKIDNRTSPVIMNYRMNAGFVPYDSWVHNDGGRIIGEGCHIIDLMTYLTGSEVIEYATSSINPQRGKFKATDNRSITLSFSDGSIAIINYFSCGSKQLSKEYLEVHFDNKSIIMNDYKSLKGFGIKVKSLECSTSRKGHKEEWLALHEGIKNGEWPIPLESMLQTSRLSILLAE